MFDSLWEEATESDWGEEERSEEYHRIQRELLKDGLTRKAKLTQLPPHEEGQPALWAIGIEGPSPLRLPEASQYPLHVSLAFDDELSDQQKEGPGAGMGRGAGHHPALPQVHQRRGRGALPEVNSESVQRARETSYYGQRRPLHISF